MHDREFRPAAFSRFELQRIVGKLRHCLQSDTPDDPYLASATDLADVERRLRLLEHANSRPLFVTFNH